MFALGQKRTLKRFRPMSALPPKADILRWKKMSLFDHLVGAVQAVSAAQTERRTDQRSSSLPAKFGNVGRELYRQELQD